MLKKDSSSPKPRKWYNSYKFPLVPLLRIRKANEHNTGWFSFQWLFFQVWSRDAFDFEISLVISEHWGIGFIGLLPYLRWVICIPLPDNIGIWAQNNLWRKPGSSFNTKNFNHDTM